MWSGRELRRRRTERAAPVNRTVWVGLTGYMARETYPNRSGASRAGSLADRLGHDSRARVPYGVAMAAYTDLEVGDRTIRISNPGRVYFPARGATKLDLARYYLSVGDGIVRALRERPCMLHRFPSGVSGEKVHQKRVPAGAPDWLETVRVTFPRYNRHADELCVTELASVIWAVQMSTVEFHPWNSRRADTEKPDEWRIDLDPMPDCRFGTVRDVALVVRDLLAELGITGWPKTSGGHGLHVYVRIEPRWGFGELRRAALAFALEVERRAP